MPFITSRPCSLPQSAKEMARWAWFNMWPRQYWPYKQLVAGDVLYWYETKQKRLVWETHVEAVGRREYANKEQAAKFIKRLGPMHKSDPHYSKAPSRGYCLAYKVTRARRYETSKRLTSVFPRLGWSRPGEAAFKALLGVVAETETTTLDALVPAGTLADRVRGLGKKMAHVSPQRVTSIVEHTDRRDTPFIRMLKRASGCKCLFPGCTARIRTKKGSLYVEVAHIQPVHRGGRSTLGNLLVLCPNHHKEFDLGNRVIKEVTISRVRGTLNGRSFKIHLPWGTNGKRGKTR